MEFGTFIRIVFIVMLSIYLYKRVFGRVKVKKEKNSHKVK
jgi:hypothetical protein